MVPLHRVSGRAAIVGLTLAACSASSSSSSGPSDTSNPSTPNTPSNPLTRAQYDDTAHALALTTALPGGGGAVTSMSDVISLARGSTPRGLSVVGGHAQGARGGVDYGYALTCKTAAGATGACDAATAQAGAEASWSAEVDLPGITASVSAMASWSATGLGTATAALSGDSAFSASVTLQSILDPSIMASYSFDASAAYDVQISTQQPQIVDGSATADVAARAMDATSRSFEAHAKITFHGDHTAEIVLDGTEHYTLDLATGRVVRDGP